MDELAEKEQPIPAEKPAAPKPAGLWGTVLTTTPIVLTVLATVFAGLSSSEMTRSMYFRSLAAQDQSKAGDQWAFFQAKRIRGTNLEMTVELLQSLAHAEPFNPEQAKVIGGHVQKLVGESASPVNAAAKKLDTFLSDEKSRQLMPYLTGSDLPKIDSKTLANREVQENLEAVVKAISQRQTEEQTADLVRKLNPEDIAAAIQLAEQNADAFDKACDPINDSIKQLRTALGGLTAAARSPRQQLPMGAEKDAPAVQVRTLLDGLNNSFKSASLDFDARRYRQESFYNRKAAELYEVRVRRSGLESDRHRERSKKFFYSMLAAQAGVTIASLALARSQRNTLWLLAAAAGLGALAFSGYVYVSA